MIRKQTFAFKSFGAIVMAIVIEILLCIFSV